MPFSVSNAFAAETLVLLHNDTEAKARERVRAHKTAKREEKKNSAEVKSASKLRFSFLWEAK